MIMPLQSFKYYILIMRSPHHKLWMASCSQWPENNRFRAAQQQQLEPHCTRRLINRFACRVFILQARARIRAIIYLVEKCTNIDRTKQSIYIHKKYYTLLDTIPVASSRWPFRTTLSPARGRRNQRRTRWCYMKAPSRAMDIRNRKITESLTSLARFAVAAFYVLLLLWNPNNQFVVFGRDGSRRRRQCTKNSSCKRAFKMMMFVFARIIVLLWVMSAQHMSPMLSQHSNWFWSTQGG